LRNESVCAHLALLLLEKLCLNHYGQVLGQLGDKQIFQFNAEANPSRILNPRFFHAALQETMHVKGGMRHLLDPGFADDMFLFAKASGILT